jgi:hypothetical protein
VRPRTSRCSSTSSRRASGSSRASLPTRALLAVR